MKNLVKVLGIIAMLAVIGLAVSCEVDPDKQVKITISGIPDGANGLYAYFALAPGKSKGELAAKSDSNNKIASGGLTTLMSDTDGNPFDKEGNYYVLVFIHDELITNDNVKDTKYTFYTSSPVKIIKGQNDFTADQFKDEVANTMEEAFAVPAKTPEEQAKERVASFLGNYSVAYKQSSEAGAKTINEKISLTTDTRFYIEDDSNGTGSDKDYLDFTITKWYESTTPPTYATKYPNAFKFEGKIVTQKGFCGTDSQTGKGITNEEANGLECTMYLYFSADGKFVRTPFTKKGAEGAAENKDVVLHYTNGPVREYTKQP